MDMSTVRDSRLTTYLASSGTFPTSPSEPTPVYLVADVDRLLRLICIALQDDYCLHPSNRKAYDLAKQAMTNQPFLGQLI